MRGRRVRREGFASTRVAWRPRVRCRGVCRRWSDASLPVRRVVRPYYSDKFVTLYHGDALTVVRSMATSVEEAESLARGIVTSEEHVGGYFDTTFRAERIDD